MIKVTRGMTWADAGRCSKTDWTAWLIPAGPLIAALPFAALTGACLSIKDPTHTNLAIALLPGAAMLFNGWMATFAFDQFLRGRAGEELR
ncbi:hypothetical protein CcrSwift_gp253 [Caulobacter phage CcrSwift]|uniref:Uncharacterized protein n=1 Tax=Caulobacter phage CcrSwift TaxID=2927984 RepID=K4JTV8_9CAUD|nr:hypothetical protein D870_gp168 [Caulobacter phage CcrSwift]AFU88571.1 hypothetical protein CcrSwift_gp253 [Caulobacter phage CcrSwift]